MSVAALVIGAGIMGCGVAYRLRQAGWQVTLIDPQPPGSEATGAAAGILSAQVEASGPGLFLDLAQVSLQLHDDWAHELVEATGQDTGLRRDGVLLLGRDDPADGDDAEMGPQGLRRRRQWQEQRGLAVQTLSGKDIRQLEPNLQARGEALFFPREGQVEPRKLLAALWQAGRQLGVRWLQGTVLRVLHEGTHVLGADVRSETGAVQSLHADHVVLCAGCWSSLLPGSTLVPQAVEPVRGQVAELWTPQPLLRHVVYGATQGAALHGYVVPRADGRLLLGATSERVGFDKAVTVDGLQSLLHLGRGLVPALAEAELRACWAGLRPASQDGLPIVGETPVEGLSICTGHYRNGILLGPVSVELMAAQLLQRRPARLLEARADWDLSPLSPRRFWAGPAAVQ